jgi:ribosome maturation factor RimP
MTEPADALVAVVEPVIAALGLDLYDLELTGRAGAHTLRVMIDRDGGVDLDAITAVSEAVSPMLDHDPAVAAVLRGPYTLEVTSPGLERPLRTPEHFRRAVGETVSVKTGAGPTARRRRGVLSAADREALDLELDDGTRERVSLADVVQARTVFDWGAPEVPRRAKRRSRQKVRS